MPILALAAACSAKPTTTAGWLGALLPAVGVNEEFEAGIALTPAGSGAFPSLTALDLSTGPYHGYFSNIGELGVLGVGAITQNAIIIGARGGSVTNPEVPNGVVPEPAAMSMMALGMLCFLAARRRNRR